MIGCIHTEYVSLVRCPYCQWYILPIGHGCHYSDLNSGSCGLLVKYATDKKQLFQVRSPPLSDQAREFAKARELGTLLSFHDDIAAREFWIIHMPGKHDDRTRALRLSGLVVRESSPAPSCFLSLPYFMNRPQLPLFRSE